MTPEFETKPVSEQDYDNLFGIHEEVFREHIDKIWGWNEDWQKERFRLNWDTCETVLITSGGKCIGFIQTIDSDEHLFLKNIAIIPSHQGKEIGRKLMIDLQARAGGSKKPLRLSVFVTNPRAERFYERLGFLVERQDDGFHHMVWTGAVAKAGEQIVGDNPIFAPSVER